MPLKKQWHFELLIGGVSGITVVKNGLRLKNKKGSLLEGIINIGTPSTRVACEKAKNFVDQAIEVNHV